MVAVTGGGDAVSLQAKLDALHGDIKGVISVGLAGALVAAAQGGRGGDRRPRDPGPRDLALFAISGASRWRRNWRVRIRARSPPATRSWKMPRPRRRFTRARGALVVDMESAVAGALRRQAQSAVRGATGDFRRCRPCAAAGGFGGDEAGWRDRDRPGAGLAPASSVAGAGPDPHRARLEQGVQGITPLREPLRCRIFRTGSLTSSSRHGGRRRIPPAAGATDRYRAPSVLRSSRPGT